MKTGWGFRPHYLQNILLETPAVGFFEAISENFLNPGGRPWEMLEALRADYDLCFHGVSLSIGSKQPPALDYLKRLKTLYDYFDPLWVSDHLCWTRNAHWNSHDLLPLPYTQETLSRTANHIDAVQNFLGRPIALENLSSYLVFSGNELSEAELLAEVAKKTGCGVLLDVNNLIVNQRNLGLDPSEALAQLKDCWVPQIHIAGHAREDGISIDTHDHRPSPEAYHLLRVANGLWPQARPLLEWDANFPSFQNILQELQTIEALWNQGPLIASTPQPRVVIKNENPPIADPFNTFSFLVTDAIGNDEDFEAERPVGFKRGLEVYHHAYWLRLESALRANFPITAEFLQTDFGKIAVDFFSSHPSLAASIDEGTLGLPEFLDSIEWHSPYEFLADLARWERAHLLAIWSQPLEPDPSLIAELSQGLLETHLEIQKNVEFLTLSYDILEFLDRRQPDRELSPLTPNSTTFSIFRTPKEIKVTRWKTLHPTQFEKPLPLEDLLAQFGPEEIKTVIEELSELAALGLLRRPPNSLTDDKTLAPLVDEVPLKDAQI